MILFIQIVATECRAEDVLLVPEGAIVSAPMDVVEDPAGAASAFAKAAGMNWSSLLSKDAGLDQRSQRWSDEVDAVSIEVSLDTGTITLRDRGGYNQVPVRLANVAPDVDTALEATRALIDELESYGFVVSAELGMERAMVSHRYVALDSGADPEGRPVGPSTDTFVVDTRITVPRFHGEIQVAGEGIEVVWGEGVTLDMLNLQWRDIRAVSNLVPVQRSFEQAKSELVEQLDLGVDDTLAFDFADLVWPDLDPDAAISEMAPAYVFVFRIDTAVGDEMTIAGKSRIVAVPVSDAKFEATIMDELDMSDEGDPEPGDPTPPDTLDDRDG